MSEFLNPFSGVTPGRKLTARELTRSVRLALSAEEEAIHLYESLADTTDNELARNVFQSIADEERVHAGEFLRLLNLLLADETAMLTEGAAEVDEIVAGAGNARSVGAETDKNMLTVGNLRT